MPNQRNVSLSEGCKRYDEAIRAIPKYLYNAEKEPKEKHREKLEKLSEVDARLYMQSVNRAELAIEYALERAEELEEEC